MDRQSTVTYFVHNYKKISIVYTIYSIQHIISNGSLSISTNRNSQHVKMLIHPVSNI